MFARMECSNEHQECRVHGCAVSQGSSYSQVPPTHAPYSHKRTQYLCGAFLSLGVLIAAFRAAVISHMKEKGRLLRPLCADIHLLRGGGVLPINHREGFTVVQWIMNTHAL